MCSEKAKKNPHRMVKTTRRMVDTEHPSWPILALLFYDPPPNKWQRKHQFGRVLTLATIVLVWQKENVAHTH